MKAFEVCDNSTCSLEGADRQTIDDLRRIGSFCLSDLKSDEGNDLWLFPSDKSEYGDFIGSMRAFSVSYDGMQLETNNVMGFIGVNGTLVRIRSRFAADDEEDYFMHYMLMKRASINLFDLNYQTADEEVFDLLLYVFPSFLVRALKQGIFREYTVKHYNDARLKGRIDVGRHLRDNTPFRGNVAYDTREYEADNRVLQLVRHTIEHIADHPLGSTILANVGDAIEQVRRFTPTYRKSDRRRVILSNVRPLSHPYYTKYRELQQLCLRILRHEELKYGRRKDEIYGVLFDGAWLWEEYLAGILSPLGFIHPENRRHLYGRKLFVDGDNEIYPDLYNDRCILDAKYKTQKDTKFGLNKDDIYQLTTYMHCLNIGQSAAISPVAVYEPPRVRHLSGVGGTVCRICLPVVQSAPDFKTFCCLQHSNEERLKTDIATLFLTS